MYKKGGPLNLLTWLKGGYLKNMGAISGGPEKIWNKKQFLLHSPLQLKLWLVPYNMFCWGLYYCFQEIIHMYFPLQAPLVSTVTFLVQTNTICRSYRFLTKKAFLVNVFVTDTVVLTFGKEKKYNQISNKT